ncbi:MAG: TetR/AcrR family transcriptional regulator [Acidimicrobiales bacterium]
MAASTSAEPAGRPSRREEILSAAAEVIAERGFKGATVRDIGDAAGMLSGSLYYHFESKEQIVLDLLLPSVEAQYEEAVSLRAAAASETEALQQLIRSSVITSSKNPHKTVILRNSGRTFEEYKLLAPISNIRRDSLALWTDVLAKGIANGEFRDDMDPSVVVHGLLDGILGAARWFTHPPIADPEHVIESLTLLYVSGLQGSAKS